MQEIPYPDDFDVDYHADLQWRRAEMARKSLTVSDVLAEVDHLIASDPDEQHHPLYSLVAHALDGRTQTGPGTALQERFARMIDHCIEVLIESKLSDVGSWEVD